MTNQTSPRDILLLVDDSPETLGFLTDALEQSGFSVLIATSGQAALGIVERITPDLILLDAIMPGMDGFETCRRLKGLGTIAQVPVIFMTGLTETEHVVNALDAGGVDYLTKPINIDELRARIRVHLANARSAISARVALDAAGRHLLAIKGDGSIHWSTPQATRLMANLAASEPHETLSTTMKHWLNKRHSLSSQSEQSFFYPPSRAEEPTDKTRLTFTFLGTIGEDEFLFRLTANTNRRQEDSLKQAFGLTIREAEVLLWIAHGKSNRDIAEILGLSARTVNKHLEQIYIKLGVENRASAAVKAAGIMHEG